jgi:hypothetical protein
LGFLKVLLTCTQIGQLWLFFPLKKYWMLAKCIWNK